MSEVFGDSPGDKMASLRILLCLLGLVSVCCVGDVGGSWWKKFGQDLRSGLSEVLDPVAVDYYKAVIDVKYNATTIFNMRGMGPLYNSTTAIIDTIAKKDAYPEGIVIYITFKNFLLGKFLSFCMQFGGLFDPIVSFIIAPCNKILGFK